MIHEHDLMILTGKTKQLITLKHCSWCLEKYILELQKIEDIHFCTPKCRDEWENYIETDFLTVPLSIR